MKRKYILMMLLLFGVISSCGKISVDRRFYVETVVNNETPYSVVLKGYSEESTLNGNEWQIDSHGQISIVNQLPMGPSYFTPAHCDSVLFTFGDGKTLMAGSDMCQFFTPSIEMVSENYRRKTYLISKELYDLAR